MTDAHCHAAAAAAGCPSAYAAVAPDDWPAVACAAAAEPGSTAFYGVHPWRADSISPAAAAAALAERLAAEPEAGVGEIGLDRLRSRETGPAQNALFAAQLEVAARFFRPVVLHGAKCWGEVVRACRPFAWRIPAFLFHGFSRSGGLLDEIRLLGGFVSVSPAILNDHAVNYRRLVSEIGSDLLLAETDAEDPSPDRAATLRATVGKLAELRRTDAARLEAELDANFRRFIGAGCRE